MADETIARHLQPGDLVITADIPLAAAVIERGGHALNHGDRQAFANQLDRFLTRHAGP
jgi:uncharacterized protein YaiI (UPF0178 family)